MIRHSTTGIVSIPQSRQIRALIRQSKINMAGNRKLKIYGTLHCRSGKKMSPLNRVFFNSEAAAREAGYRPCGHCMKAAYAQWKAVQHDNNIS